MEEEKLRHDDRAGRLFRPSVRPKEIPTQEPFGAAAISRPPLSPFESGFGRICVTGADSGTKGLTNQQHGALDDLSSAGKERASNAR